MALDLPRPLHSWNLPPRAAIALQRQLADRVVRERPRGPFRWIAGLDAAFSDGGRVCVAAVVLWDARRRLPVECHVARRAVRFPYVPGLLTFREAPALLAALRRLSRRPDVLMFDGQGLAHPRRFGIASHLGVFCGLPSIGCAKSLLVGEFETPGPARGDFSPLLHEGERIGEVVRSQDGIRPLFVSVGHRMDQATARRLVLRCAVRHRLPEPTRLADRLVARARQENSPESGWLGAILMRGAKEIGRRSDDVRESPNRRGRRAGTFGAGHAA